MDTDRKKTDLSNIMGAVPRLHCETAFCVTNTTVCLTQTQTQFHDVQKVSMFSFFKSIIASDVHKHCPRHQKRLRTNEARWQTIPGH